ASPANCCSRSSSTARWSSSSTTSISSATSATASRCSTRARCWRRERSRRSRATRAFRRSICAVPDDQPFLDIKHLAAGYGRRPVLFDVNIGIPWRGGVAVLGRNGAGKTTLMKTIVGELASTQGELTFDGRDITRSRTEQRVRSGIGYVPQEHSVF